MMDSKVGTYEAWFICCHLLVGIKVILASEYKLSYVGTLFSIHRFVAYIGNKNLTYYTTPFMVFSVT